MLPKVQQALRDLKAVDGDSERQADPYAGEMEDYTAAADKFFKDTEHLDSALKAEQIDLALSIAKRGRRHLTLLIKALADERDNQLHD